MNLGGPSYWDVFDKDVTLIAKLDRFERHRATRFTLNFFGYVATLLSTSFFWTRLRFCFCWVRNDNHEIKSTYLLKQIFNGCELGG